MSGPGASAVFVLLGEPDCSAEPVGKLLDRVIANQAAATPRIARVGALLLAVLAKLDRDGYAAAIEERGIDRRRAGEARVLAVLLAGADEPQARRALELPYAAAVRLLRGGDPPPKPPRGLPERLRRVGAKFRAQAAQVRSAGEQVPSGDPAQARAALKEIRKIEVEMAAAFEAVACLRAVMEAAAEDTDEREKTCTPDTSAENSAGTTFFPENTQSTDPKGDKPPVSSDALDARWRQLTTKQRSAAEAKAAAIRGAVERHERTGEPLQTCLHEAAAGTPWSPHTIYSSYYGRTGEPGLSEFPRHQWAMALAPRYHSGRPSAQCDPEAWEWWKRDYLRPEEPTLKQTFRRLETEAKKKGWKIPKAAKTLHARLYREMHVAAITLARKGPQALLESRPSAMRDYRSIRAMDLWVADGRESDVMVLWPDGKEARPWITGWKDVAKRKIVGYRVDRSESSDSYRLSLADAVREFGVPGAVMLDNSSGAASKMLTGGCHWRFRGGKPKAGEVEGLLTQLVGPENIHWQKPYRGRSKTIERSFKDLSADLDKDQRLQGAYTGRSPAHKPDYGPGAKPKPVPLAVYLEVVEEAIAEHNSRRGRRGEGLAGMSFDAAFSAGLAERADDPPARLSSAQMERWLLAPDESVAHAKDGVITLHGGRYWSEALGAALAGRTKAERTVVVRFDPDHLDRPILVETRDGRLIARAEPIRPTPFLDTQAARDAARDEARWRKIAKEQLDIGERKDRRALERLQREEPAGEPEPARKLVTAHFGVAARERPAAEVGEEDRRAADQAVIEMAERMGLGEEAG